MFSSKGKTLFDDGESSDVTALIIGAPGEKHLKSACKVIRDATQQLMTSEDGLDGSVLQYGPQLGSPFYRDELSKFLSDRYGDVVNKNNVLLTCGATHGLHLSTILVPPHSCVFLEDPTYFVGIQVLKDDLKMETVPVLTDEFGIDTVDLEEKIKVKQQSHKTQLSNAYPYWGMCYIIPTFNNPKATCLSPDRCRKIVTLARTYNLLIVCDDVYNILNFTEEPPPARLLSYDDIKEPGDKGHIISNGSFSKLFSPGVRIGWIEASDSIINMFEKSAITKSGGACNNWTSQVIATALKTGSLQKHLEMMICDLKERNSKMCQVLKENLPSGCTFLHPKGGYFLWLKLPEEINSSQVADEALKLYKVGVLPGEKCSPTRSYKNCIRLSFARYGKEEIEQATLKLCHTIAKFVQNQGA